MPVRVLRDAPQQLVAELVLGGDGVVGGYAGVRLVDDDEVGAVPYEVVAVPGGLDVVRGDDDVRVPVEQRLAEIQAAFEAGDRGGEDQFGVDAELGPQLLLPLLGQGGRTEHGQALGLTLGQEFLRDQARLDGLADSDVVGDQHPYGLLPQRHQQRDELVGAGLHGDAGEGAERSGAGAEADPQGGAQQPGRPLIAEVGRGRGRELSVPYLLERGEDGRDVVVGAAQGTQHQQVGLAVGKDDPFAATGGDQGARGVGVRHRGFLAEVSAGSTAGRGGRCGRAVMRTGRGRSSGRARRRWRPSRLLPGSG